MNENFMRGANLVLQAYGIKNDREKQAWLNKLYESQLATSELQRKRMMQEMGTEEAFKSELGQALIPSSMYEPPPGTNPMSFNWQMQQSMPVYQKYYPEKYLGLAAQMMKPQEWHPGSFEEGVKFYQQTQGTKSQLGTKGIDLENYELEIRNRANVVIEKGKKVGVDIPYNEAVNLIKPDVDKFYFPEKPEKAPTEIEQFEIETGTSSELRGTKEYGNKINEWRKTAKRPLVEVDLSGKTFTAIGTEMGKNIVEEHKTTLQARDSLMRLQDAKKILSSGIITGIGAEAIVSIGKALQQIGINLAPEPIANTEAFTSMMGNQVGQIIKQFGSGTGLSDADRDYAEKIAGGKITLTKQSIEKIIAINEKGLRNVIKNYNIRANQVMSKPEAKELPYDLRIKMSPELEGNKFPNITPHGGKIEEIEE
jgi:hypothetical protein